MRKKSFIFFITTITIFGYGQNIYTIAGNGNLGYSGDGGPASNASIGFIADVATDFNGNVYIADITNHCIRKIDATGVITTIVGTGVAGFSGDGGQANLAKINYPYGIASDAVGNIYIVDAGNERIRKVNTSGVISSIVGTGISGFSGDGGAAILSQVNGPSGIAIDGSNNIYVVDGGNRRIRKINSSGVISTVAGTGALGFSGDGGPATSAEFAFGVVNGIDVDSGGNIFVTDAGNDRVRVILSNGVVNTIAGNPTSTVGCGSTGIPALSAPLVNLVGVMVDGSGNVYVPMQFGCSFLRKVNTSGIISNAAGNSGNAGTSGDGGLATQADLYDPWTSAIDSNGNIYIVGNGYKVRVVCNSNCLAGINQLFDVSSKVNIYPNPVSNTLFISGEQYNLQNSEIEIINSLGQSVLKLPFKNEIDISRFSQGYYILKIITQGKQRFNAKFMKE